MLGEHLGEFRRKLTGQRLRPTEDGSPKVETSFEITGAILGLDATMWGTSWSIVRRMGRCG
jgi:hypothetical protein